MPNHTFLVPGIGELSLEHVTIEISVVYIFIRPRIPYKIVYVIEHLRNAYHKLFSSGDLEYYWKSIVIYLKRFNYLYQNLQNKQRLRENIFGKRQYQSHQTQ